MRLGQQFIFKMVWTDLFFCSEDTCALAEKLIQCIRCRQELAIIGSRSREIYERIFSMEVFERNLLAIVSQILPLPVLNGEIKESRERREHYIREI